MASITDGHEATSSPPPAADPRLIEGLRSWRELAAGQALVLKQDIIDGVRAASRRLLSASCSGIRNTKEAVEWLKIEYAAIEDELVKKVKEGVVIAAANPNLSVGIAAGVGLVALKRPRRFLIHNTRKLFVSEEFLFSQAEAKVNQLRQSVNSMKNDVKKISERASKAEDEMRRGWATLSENGSKIQSELRYANRIEREALDLKEFVSEIPVAEYQSQINDVMSKVKQEKKVLNRMLSRITKCGILVLEMRVAKGVAFDAQ